MNEEYIKEVDGLGKEAKDILDGRKDEKETPDWQQKVDRFLTHLAAHYDVLRYRSDWSELYFGPHYDPTDGTPEDFNRWFKENLEKAITLLSGLADDLRLDRLSRTKPLTRPDDAELSEQLVLDSKKKGESRHVEYKDFNLAGLSDTKISDGWKDDLGHEMAGFASTAGRIYIGIEDNGTIVGIEGKEQDWSEKLIERAVGSVKPRVNWSCTLFEDAGTKLHVLRIDVAAVEPIYYFKGKPYLRDGTSSRPAEPEEVKERFRQHFAHRPLPSASEETKAQGAEKTEAGSWLLDMVLEAITSLNLYEEKQGPQRDPLKASLRSIREDIESNLPKARRVFGKESFYLKKLTSLSGNILKASKVTMLIDGGKSWNEWVEALQATERDARDLFDHLKTNANIRIDDLDFMKQDSAERAVRWLDSIGDELTTFIYEAPVYSRNLLRVGLFLSLAGEPSDAKEFKAAADELERLSWATSNTDYQAIIEAIPKLKQKINLLPFTKAEREILIPASTNKGQINKITVDTIPEGFLRIGDLNFDFEGDTRKRSEYTSAFDNLIAKGFVEHVSGNLYQLTSLAWDQLAPGSGS